MEHNNTEFPPNYKELCEAFDIKDSKTTVFTWGDTLYNPFNIPISQDLLVHEMVHSQQQRRLIQDFETDQKGARLWYKRYINDPAFRLDQELEAYRNQYHFVVGKVKDRNKVAKVLYQIAQALSSEMYGNIIGHTEAMKQIKVYPHPSKT